jgi:hypothetical protein
LDLHTLLLDLGGKSHEEKVQEGRRIYKQLYLTHETKPIGIFTLHDGEQVIFYEDSFDHAFYKSSNYQLYPKRKDLLDDERLKRIRWIGAVLLGKVPDSSCWEVQAGSGRHATQPNRVYVVDRPCYVVWLEPRKDRGQVAWKFMSAYPANPKHLIEKCKQGACVWSYQQDLVDALKELTDVKKEIP